MSTKKDVQAFLVSRRANVSPEQLGLQRDHDDRRVPGLRREEVARLAGVSPDYYARLERGNIRGASESVLNAVARALQLSDVERRHLFDLARTAPHTAMAGQVPTHRPRVRASVQRVIDSLSVPVIVFNAQHDLVAANFLGRALCSPLFDAVKPNLARFTFLDPRAQDYYADWPLARQRTAAMLRFEAGRDPLNDDLTSLIDELSTLSPLFRQNWAQHDVHEHRTGRKVFLHPVVGSVEVTFDVFELPGEPGIWIVTYTPDEGSETADRLALLASWAATQETGTAGAADLDGGREPVGEGSRPVGTDR